MSDFAEFNLLIHNGQHRPSKRARQSVERNKPIPAALDAAHRHQARSPSSPPATKLPGEVFQKATSVIDRVADKNIIHKNKAAATRAAWLPPSRRWPKPFCRPGPRGVMNTANKNPRASFSWWLQIGWPRACPASLLAPSSLLAHRRQRHQALRPVFGIHRIHPERERARQRPHLRAIADEVERRQRIDDGHAQPLAHEGADRHG